MPRRRRHPLAADPRVACAVLLAIAAMVAVRQPRSAGAAVLRDGSVITVTNQAVRVDYDLSRGVAQYSWGERTVIRNGYSSAVLAGAADRQIYSFEGDGRRVADRAFSDPVGRGVALSVTTEFVDADVALVQQIFVYDGVPFVTQRVSVERLSEAAEPVTVAQVEVLAASQATASPGGIAIEPAGDQRFYQVPFSNNDDFAVVPRPQAAGVLSSWLGGVVDVELGPGAVLGALETTRWKSGVWYDGPSGAISAVSGLRSPVDTQPPAPVTDQRVDSALTFVGFRHSYQDALADLMGAVRAVEPPLPAPPLPAPIGWSAWYGHRHAADEATVRGVTDFIADHWSSLGYRYINLDAGWNRADGDTRADPVKFPGGMEQLVAHIHDRGLLAGAYYVPFAISPTLLDEPAPGSAYRYRDLLLRDATGAPVRASILNWEYVVDPTHPGALPLLYSSAKRIADYGFDFVKLDFLQIGTQEGVRHDPSVTAMQAFHQAMQAITDAWSDSGRPIFISAAISPLYVQPYVHSRRVGNDVEFGQARQAKNVALSWFTGLLYHRNDPDNAVVRRDWFPGYTDGLAKLHVTMDALGGTLFIAGDDPRKLSPARAALLTNEDMLAVAREPLVIRPLELEDDPPPIWYAAEDDGSYLVGIFNWDGDDPARYSLPLADLGLTADAAYRAVDLWTGQELAMTGGWIVIDLAPHDAALLRITGR